MDAGDPAAGGVPDPDRTDAIARLADGFGMIGDDFEQGQFCVAVRHDYRAAAVGSPTRGLMAMLMQKLDF